MGATAAFTCASHPNNTWGVDLHDDRIDSKIPVDQSWHHHCAVFDGSTVKYYVNGELAVEEAKTLNTIRGRVTLGNYTGTGLLDEFVLYDRAISDSEVQQLYSAGQAGTGVAELLKRNQIEARQSVVDIGSLEWSEPRNLGPIVNGSSTDKGAALSADGLTLIFHSERKGGQGSHDLWISSRESQDAPFQSPVNLGAVINSNEVDSGPHLSGDGLTLYFTSNRSGGEGSADIWMSRRTNMNASWENPVNLGPNVNSNRDDAGPSLASDGLVMVFSSARQGSLGRNDIYMCTRQSVSEPFGPAINLGETVNCNLTDASPCISADGLALVFASGPRRHIRWQ